MGRAARDHRRQAEEQARVASPGVVQAWADTDGEPSLVAAALRGLSDPLDALDVLHEIARDVRRLEVRQVQLARSREATWVQIGLALGITPQAAQQRFSGRS